MSEKVIVLPDAEEIVRRLKTVFDEPSITCELYQLVAKSAGDEVVAEGVAMMFILAIYTFVMSCGYPPALRTQMHYTLISFVPKFIDALVDDKEVAAEAKAQFAEATAAKGK